MDTLQERGLLEGLAVRDDGTVDLTELAREALESVLNQVMDAQAGELCGEGNRRNCHREPRQPIRTPAREATSGRTGFHMPQKPLVGTPGSASPVGSGWSRGIYSRKYRSTSSLLFRTFSLGTPIREARAMEPSRAAEQSGENALSSRV